MSDNLIRRAREALVDVTPGPWHHDGHTGVMASGSVDTYSGPVWATIIRAEQTSEMDGDGRSWETSGNPDANARFIAAARDLVPEMAARLEAQEALLREAMCGLSVLLHVYDGVPMNPIEAERRATEARATLAKLRAHLDGVAHA